MRKVVVHSAGGYDKLRVEEHPDPAPGPGEVLIRVAAAGVNFADAAVRMGLYDSAKKYVGWPITPGFEVSGDVIAVGEGVSAWARGQRVIAVTRFGGYASRVVVAADQVFECPDDLELAQAAGLPAVFMTAYYALFELCRLRRGDSLLVHSAAGGVGSAVLQLARHEGWRAVGVVGASAKVEAAKRMGATHVIDKSREDLWARARELEPEGYDVVLDANGVSTLRQSLAHTKEAGRLVVFGFASMMPHTGRPNWVRLGLDYLRTPRFNPFELVGQNKSVMAFNLSYLFDKKALLQEAMGTLLGLVRSGALRTLDVLRFSVDRVADAHRAIESGQTVGKLILTFGE